MGHVGTVAFGIVDREIALLSEAIPEYFYFYGYTSPLSDIPGYVYSLVRLLRKLKRVERERRVLIDTTGWISGYSAFSLKLLKLELFRPDAVILIGSEVFDWYSYIKGFVKEVFLLLPSQYVVPKDMLRREKNRIAITIKYFSEKPLVKLEKNLIPCVGKYSTLEEGRLVGFLDSRFETLATGWVVKDQGKEVLLHIYKQYEGKVSFLKIGDKVGGRNG
ncbi:MAG: Clp1/GlmU family protein [Thermosulfidibacteraceae bacterium]